MTLLTRTPGIAFPPCSGDCNTDWTVTVNEIIKAVSVAAGHAPLQTCAAADSDRNGQITIAEVIVSVNAALTGCTLPHPTFGGEVRFSFHEQVDRERHTVPQLFLTVSSVEIFPCANYGLENAVLVEDRAVTVVLGGVLPPLGLCLTALGPATFRQRVDLDDGDYTVQLRSAWATDRYLLSLLPDSIEVDPVETSFSTPYAERTARVPRNIIVVQCARTRWGYEDPSQIVDELCPLLFAEVDTIATPAPGVNVTALPTYCEPADFDTGRCRAYHYTGSIDTLAEVFEGAGHYDLPRGYLTDLGDPRYYKYIVTWLGHGFCC